MATIWPAYEGYKSPDWPWAELSLPEAIKMFELSKSDLLSGLELPPSRLGLATRDLWFAGYKHIIVEIGKDEAEKEKWESGFYRSRIEPREGYRRLIEQPFVSVLGPDNVERVQFEPGLDSQGQGAWRITVVISPGAIQRLPRGATLQASARLRERLGEMRDERTPIIEYATEAELVQDAGP